MATFSFINLSSGSVYFFMESVTTSSFYTANSPTNAIGTYSSFTGSGGLVTSSYIFGVILPEGSSSFVFTPTASIATGSVYFRGTGNLTATITV
jgi:hypothetical protein